MRRAPRRWVCTALAGLLVGAMPRLGQAVDCSTRFPVGAFALTRDEVAHLARAVSGFSPVYLLKKPVLIEASGGGDPCELVYGFDVFELADGRRPGALVAGCRGDFDGDGRRDSVVLLRRDTDGAQIPHVFLARGRTFDVVRLEPAGDPSAWTGPSCIPKPPTGLFEVPDGGAKVRIVGDLFTIGWYTYYWRPDLGRFDAIITTD